jgi:hypothetical protein
MNISNNQCTSEQYAVISYSHEETSAEKVKNELKMYEENGVCYWYDNAMEGGKSYREQFFNALDNNNCKGIIFFINEPFLFSPNCAAEVKYFLDNYGVNNEDKFCFFVLPSDFPISGANDKAVNSKNLKIKVSDYVKNCMKENPENEEYFLEHLTELGKHIDWFLDISKNGEALCGFLGNLNNYIEKYCEDGQIFKNYGIIYGHKQIDNIIFGYFPQNEKQKTSGAKEIEKYFKERILDKTKAYYAPVEWIVIRDDNNSQTLLSKHLLFSIDYLSLMFPYSNGLTVNDFLKDSFEFFEPDEDRRKIKKIRFLLKEEFDALFIKRKNYIQKKRELLLPDYTYFAQISNRKNAPAFWLAGDMEDARRVDTGLEGLSDQPAGVELYYVRVVIEVEKTVD